MLLTGTAAHANGWSDLWLRPDQQSIGQRQQAVAEIQAQQYAAAAEHLKPFADPESQYNRGNALARAGDLQAAIDAYSAALKAAAPGSSLARDAEHNRDLVKEQLKAQNDRKDQGKKDQGDKGDKGDKASKADKGNQGEKGDQGNQGEKADKGGAGDKPQTADGQEQKADSGQTGASGAKDAPQPAPASAAMSHEPPPASAATPAEQQRADDAEKALSLDQWLRWIPDDPAGLLRRKFMIEHMTQQHENKP